jgi:hypothetical protein
MNRRVSLILANFSSRVRSTKGIIWGLGLSRAAFISLPLCGVIASQRLGFGDRIAILRHTVTQPARRVGWVFTATYQLVFEQFGLCGGQSFVDATE